MSQSLFIWPKIRSLLEHYESATRQLSAATAEETASSDGDRSLSDVDARAMEELLKSQALALIRLYHVTTTGENELPSACAHIRRRLKDIEQGSHSRLYAYQFDQVPLYWRQIYSDAQILTTFHILLRAVDNMAPLEQRQAFIGALDEVVARLDRCLVTVGGGGGILDRAWINKTLKMLEEAWELSPGSDPGREFSTLEPNPRMQLTRTIARHWGWSIDKFEKYMRDGHALATTTGQLGPEPVIFTDLTKDVWPAIKEKRWSQPDYLFRMTLGGRRMVPVEIGRSYVDQGWGQQLMPFREFIFRYIDGSLIPDNVAEAEIDTAPTGYLAQHDLFTQIPELRNDIQIPELCWADVPNSNPFSLAAPKSKLEMPQVNAWFGPPTTITPLHTDGYTNLLCQVVGTKYVRLYPPQAGRAMRPRSRDENGIDMSNTSAIDIGALEGWDKCIDDTMERDDDAAEKYKIELRDSLKDIEYFECILEPGDTLLIPMGWWHYVRSLSVSFSVSFWWN
ncbi:hypothetical protein NLG97_g7086 [Lecanicillium saksenae]|uniref:Uncharacterized protein n=1 Tax=Lecanicillium saksenae TaxID=468837 RepID=A0ACC1QQD1_9HYPO|nr:hypothetical protein NLG97_g7086 [Lecanicillium saksenae]